MKFDQRKAYGGNDLRNDGRSHYRKMRRIRSDLKRQNNAVFNVNDNKSVNTNFNNQKSCEDNKQRGFSKDRRSRIRFTGVCPICEKPIRCVISCMSMKFNGEDKPIHFDCAIGKVKSENELLKNESLVYRGVGKFFVVDKSVKGNNLAFKIVKEIDFENLESRPIWRNKILQEINKGFKF
ncbi:hypothetical protein [Borrelia anserina]|uniref:hypothetical protein n=1 Tax=Borrelia anserina TaxID=143 RepID=UPI00046D423F|nr:hypothetical protein [Borrelia anserina]